LALISPTSGGRSVGIVRSRTKATKFSFSLMMSLSILGWYLINLNIPAPKIGALKYKMAIFFKTDFD
jgi:hypothetical protein